MKNLTSDLCDHIRWAIFSKVGEWWKTSENDEVNQVYWRVRSVVWRPIKDKLKDLTR